MLSIFSHNICGRAGFLPGVDQEYGGIIRHGAKLLYAYCEATVPRIQLITRKAYGGAYVVMDSKSVGSDLSLAWPTRRVGCYGATGCSRNYLRRELEEDKNPELKRNELVEDYLERFANPYVACRERVCRRCLLSLLKQEKG